MLIPGLPARFQYRPEALGWQPTCAAFATHVNAEKRERDNNAPVGRRTYGDDGPPFARAQARRPSTGYTSPPMCPSAALKQPSATGTTLNLGASTTTYNFRKPHQRLRITKNRTLYRKRRKNRRPACLALFSVFLHSMAENTVPRSVVWPGEGSGGCRAWSPKRRIVAWQGLDGYGGECRLFPWSLVYSSLAWWERLTRTRA